MVDSATLHDDQFGHSVYAVVLMAPQDQVQMVSKLRETIKLTRAMPPAHLTVRGTFYRIVDLGDVDRRIAGVATTARPFRVEFGDQTESNEGRNRSVAVKISEPLRRLNADLERVINPVSRDAYGASAFDPHLTVYMDASPEQIAKGRVLCGFLDLGPGFLATSMSLIGRVGPAYGGRWVEVKRYRFGV
ncbi:MAG: 2'-5' RNA ligase family protein [Chloroflexi bacterium]|nr:2'-5' RNA ligase family protein [Chloroflexota bacterium]